MASMLLFRFITPERVEWLADARAVRQGTLAELAGQTAGQRLLLVAPGEAVLLTQAAVPGRQRATRLKAIPYALEDSLAGDVEELHFAVGRSEPGQPVPVAAVSRETLEGWLAACAQAGITPAAVIPDTLLLPYEEGAWSLLLEEERAVVRSGPWTGFATEQDGLEPLLKLALAEAGEQAPHFLRVWGELPPELTGLGPELRRQGGPGEPLQVFAAGYSPALAIDLLQGHYSRRAGAAQWLRPWRMAAALAGVWLGLQGIAQVIEYRQLQREQVSLRTRMEQLYRDAVPDAQRIVNPRVQLENRLAELRRGGSGPQPVFLELLQQGGQPLSAFQEITLRGLRYKSDQLDLDIEGGSLETLDRLKERLSQLPVLQAEVRTSKREGKVESQITLRKHPL